MVVISPGHIYVDGCFVLIIFIKFTYAGDIPRKHAGPIVDECFVLILI